MALAVRELSVPSGVPTLKPSEARSRWAESTGSAALDRRAGGGTAVIALLPLGAGS